MSTVTHLLATPCGSLAVLDPGSMHVSRHLKRNLQGCKLMNMSSALLPLATPLAWLWAQRPIRSPVLADTHPLHSNSHASPIPVLDSHQKSSRDLLCCPFTSSRHSTFRRQLLN